MGDDYYQFYKVNKHRRRDNVPPSTSTSSTTTTASSPVTPYFPSTPTSPPTGFDCVASRSGDDTFDLGAVVDAQIAAKEPPNTPTVQEDSDSDKQPCQRAVTVRPIDRGVKNTQFREWLTATLPDSLDVRRALIAHQWNGETSRSLGWGIILFHSSSDADESLHYLEGKTFLGHHLMASKSTDEEYAYMLVPDKKKRRQKIQPQVLSPPSLPRYHSHSHSHSHSTKTGSAAKATKPGKPVEGTVQSTAPSPLFVDLMTNHLVFVADLDMHPFFCLAFEPAYLDENGNFVPREVGLSVLCVKVHHSEIALSFHKIIDPGPTPSTCKSSALEFAERSGLFADSTKAEKNMATIWAEMNMYIAKFLCKASKHKPLFFYLEKKKPSPVTNPNPNQKQTFYVDEKIKIKQCIKWLASKAGVEDNLSSQVYPLQDLVRALQPDQVGTIGSTIETCEENHSSQQEHMCIFHEQFKARSTKLYECALANALHLSTVLKYTTDTLRHGQSHGT
ncbi:hypothetical protein Pelo_9561 [Pelomyxa schiedti]|nr:hypothetical protein Pelo_9561 [Pelomyxa schiedti]